MAPLLEDAADAGARKSGGMEFVGRGRGFADKDPTGTATLDPRRSQLRRAARRARTPDQGGRGDARGSLRRNRQLLLRLDPQEWVRAVEKRRAALGR
jgi:hypothetical protein